MKKNIFAFIAVIILISGCNDITDTPDTTIYNDDGTPISETDDSLWPSLSIKSSIIKESLDDAIIYGEVQNTGAIGADFVKVNATIKDAAGVILDTDFTYVNPSTLPVGKCYGFTMYTDALYSNTASAELSVSYSSTCSDNPEKDLSISGVNVVDDGLGDAKILGQVTNNSSNLKTYCKVNAIFYDSGGNVLYCDFTYTDPSSIGAGYTNSFEMYTYMPVGGYSTYKLYTTSSDNY